jgi:hypothetical protein
MSVTVVKYRLSDMSFVEYWDLSKISAKVAVVILRMNIYWSIKLCRLGQGVDQPIHIHPGHGNCSVSETVDNSQYLTRLTTKNRNFSFKAAAKI